MAQQQTVLIVDDDPHIREVLGFALKRAGFAVESAANGIAALEFLSTQAAALIILDILMPELDGIEVCRRVRANPALATIPVLFLSSKDDEIDRIVGLELGADDYVSKPFSPRELVLRVRAILRRLEPVNELDERAILQHGRLRLDLNLFQVDWDGEALELTATEFGMLRALMKRPGHVLSRDTLMTEAYAIHKVVSDRTIDSHLRRIRAKFAALGADPLETVHGIGYRLGSCQ